MRERAAPSAERTAISRTRPAPRIKRRFATLAQAIRRRKPTAASNTQRGRRTPSVVSSSMGKTLALQSLLPSGRACAVKFATRSMSWRACSSVMPALSRATAVRKRPPSLHSGAVSASGVHTSALIPGKENPLGMTPITSPGPPLTSVFSPTIPGSAPN